tara:strand:- start:2068 stop:2322 length:255 start_codon:yes stop_codon:yes gene_type:complete
LYTDRISVIIELYTGFVGKVSPIYFLTTGWGRKRGPPQQSGQKPASVKIRKKRRRGTREKKSPLQLAFFSCGSWNSRPGFWKRK